MKKDAYYFPHDSNAKDDPKCMLLIDDLGLEGYGIYWVLIELLRDQPNYIYGLCYIKSIARKYGTNEIKVKQVITGYELFEIDESSTFFYSVSLINRMEKVDNLRKTRSEAGKKGNQKRWGTSSLSDNKLITGESQIDCKKSQRKEKERKEKKIKNNTCTNIFEWFETVWIKYPRKEGKSRIINSKTKLNNLYKDKENVEKGLEGYIRHIAANKIEKQYIKAGSTFFNGDYLDYINYEEAKQTKPKYKFMN